MSQGATAAQEEKSRSTLGKESEIRDKTREQQNEEKPQIAHCDAGSYG